MNNTINEIICVEVDEIEKINILNASLKAMNLACSSVITQINNKNVLILGTGGTSKTSYNVAKDLNANKVSFVSSSKKDNALSYEDLDKYANEYQILIKTI